MPAQPVVNGHLPEGPSRPETVATETATQPQEPMKKPPRPKKKKGPNYALIHSNPLPIRIHPLPAFHPSHPISLLHLCYTYLSHILSPPTSHPLTGPKPHNCIAYFSPETRSIHVTDPVHIRALWEMGFFGKGTLSRSEPSWLEREKAKVKAARDVRAGKVGGGTAEEATGKRREERRMFKLERARVERERVLRQRAVEEGRLPAEEVDEVEVGEGGKGDEGGEGESGADVLDGQLSERELNSTEEPRDGSGHASIIAGRVIDSHVLSPAATQEEEPLLPNYAAADLPATTPTTKPITIEEPDEPEPIIPNQEHLQLTLEEAFFLSYALGVLDIIPTPTSTTTSPTPPNQQPNIYNSKDLLHLFTQHSVFPPTQPSLPLPPPDSPFLLAYTTYHHFRSLGWVVRPGVKFAVDYLLYNRGPVFSHAEFAVLIMPAYTHAYWRGEEGLKGRRVKEMKDWWWLHAVNRVQSQVRKTLVLAYVDVPPPFDYDGEGVGGGELDVGLLLKRYKVREFVIKRWLANRSRD